MSDRPEEVALEEARRAIGVQVASVDELRSRTGLLLAASSVTGSFLGSAAASNRVDVSVLGALAIVAFAVAVGACLYVLGPKRNGWTFVTSPKLLAEDWIDLDRGGVAPMQRFLAESLERHFDQNKRRLDALYGWFQVAAFAVGVEVILGSVQLATNS